MYEVMCHIKPLYTAYSISYLEEQLQVLEHQNPVTARLSNGENENLKNSISTEKVAEGTGAIAICVLNDLVEDKLICEGITQLANRSCTDIEVISLSSSMNLK